MHQISDKHLSIDVLKDILSQKKQLALSSSEKKKIQKCRSYLEGKVENSDSNFYGINTGFGELCNVSIPQKDLEQLQTNLLLSHAVGLGDEVPLDIVRLMLFLKLQSLSYGHSGVRLLLVERLIDFFNNDLLPVVFKQGSLGASGDLAPLSHMCLPLLGEGEVFLKGKKMSAKTALKKLKLAPIKLKSKEGLALINGTQFMGAYGVWNLIQAKRLIESAELVSTISLEAVDARVEPFTDSIHQIRKQKGQIETAKQIRKYLIGSDLGKREKEQVQDQYSLRCIPQVHGATRNVYNHVKEIFEDEINAVTDNPNIFPEEDLIVSGGNFHGQALAVALDYLTIGMAELGSISERRTFLLMSGLRGLPLFLTDNPGINSGLMMIQYTAASLVSQSKQLCTPASADSITSSNGQEDHVSMGANAATKCFDVISNTEKILAIELLSAVQAMDFRKGWKTSKAVANCISEFRKKVPFNDRDRFLHTDLIKSIDFVVNARMF